MPVFWICHICRSHPWHWEHGRRTAGERPSLACPMIFSVTIAEQPPRLTCGATGYHYPPPPVVASSLAKGCFGAKEIARHRAGRQGRLWPVRRGAFPRVAHSGGNVPVVLDIQLSRCPKARSFSDFAQGRGLRGAAPDKRIWALLGPQIQCLL